jgi:pyrroloquinoline-quinone synthase
MEIATEVAVPAQAVPLAADAFVNTLRQQSERYHDKHPFHVLMNKGRLNRRQIQIWVANRFYYQQSIPIKDAAIISNCPHPAIRRRWLQRLIDHDGAAEGQGGIETWLRLAEAVGLNRQEVLVGQHVLPGVRFAVDANVNFARTRPWIEAVSATLTELFAPDLMKERIAAFERYYTWVDAAGLTYFRSRLSQAPRDAAFAIELVKQYCTTRAQQDRAVAALAFKCDVLWSVLDAIQHASLEQG